MSEQRRRTAINLWVKGGLGNQLFQYFSGLAIAQSLGADLILDLTYFSKVGARPFELDPLLMPDVQIAEPRSPRGVLQRDLRSAIARRFGFVSEGGRLQRVVWEKGPGYDQSLEFPKAQDFQLVGYFQSWKYFISIRELAQSLFLRLMIQSHYSHEDLLKPHITLHVRRGDYLSPYALDYHGITPREYYIRAARTARNLVGQLPIRIYSDSPQLADDLLTGIIPNIEIVSVGNSLGSLSTMLTMSQAKAVICANSSFSWWAAWIRDDLDRPVLCPRPWFRSSRVPLEDLLLPHWISLG